MSVFVERFEWLVHHDGSDHWVRLMVGEGWALLDTSLMDRFARPRGRDVVERTARDRLAAARRIEGDGLLRAAVMREPAADGIERAEPLPGAVVLGCRALGFADPDLGRLRSHERPPLEVLYEVMTAENLDPSSTTGTIAPCSTG